MGEDVVFQCVAISFRKARQPGLERGLGGRGRRDRLAGHVVDHLHVDVRQAAEHREARALLAERDVALAGEALAGPCELRELRPAADHGLLPDVSHGGREPFQ